MDRTWLPVQHSWRLNERHYGALQGLNKAETAKQYGDEQVLVWRRSYDTPPPALEASDPRCERGDLRYAGLAPEQVPLTECLKDTVERVLPFWNDTVAPTIRSGKRVVIAAHGNSIRALVKYLDNISDEDIVGLNIPNGIPLVYELDAELKPLRQLLPGRRRGRGQGAQPRWPRKARPELTGQKTCLAGNCPGLHPSKVYIQSLGGRVHMGHKLENCRMGIGGHAWLAR